jgi:hypothetical protein
MRKKIADGGFETPYRLRKQIVEAVFGQIKQARGFRQFLGPGKRPGRMGDDLHRPQPRKARQPRQRNMNPLS